MGQSAAGVVPYQNDRVSYQSNITAPLGKQAAAAAAKATAGLSVGRSVGRSVPEGGRPRSTSEIIRDEIRE